MADVSIASARTVQDRLKLCQNLLTLREKMVAGAGNAKVGIMAGRRMAAIRRVLLGRGEVSITDELMTPKAAGLRLLAELEAVKDKPEAERVAVAAYARAIMNTLNVIHGAESRIGLSGDPQGFSDELIHAISKIIPGDSTGYRQVDPVIDACIERGVFGLELRDELKAATLAGNAIDDLISAETYARASDYGNAVAENNQMVAKVRELRNLTYTNGVEGRAAYDAAYAEYLKFLEEVYRPIEKASNEVLAARQSKSTAAYTSVGNKLIATVMDASPITPDAATKWAKAQEITPQAVARFRKIGYPVDQVRLDMAEFYRFTGGRVVTVRIHSNGSRRANATDIEAHGKVGTINLAASFDKRVLWHELAHHMEADPLAKMASGQFIRRRSVDGKQYTLRSITGNKGYRPDEVALKGGFFSPYVGKVYRDGVTEVFSMGVESFSDPKTLAQRAAQDPQTLEFVAGFVKAPLDPLAKAHTALREMVREMEEEAIGAVENSLADMLKALADTVELTPDTNTEWIAGGIGYYAWANHATQIGQFEQSGYYLLSGKVRNIRTKRTGNGLILARRDSGGWIQRSEITSTDQTVVKAMYALYKKNGVMPNYYNMDDMDYLKRQAA